MVAFKTQTFLWNGRVSDHPVTTFESGPTERSVPAQAATAGSAVVFDVTLLDAWVDDADAGYYEDSSFSVDALRSRAGAEELSRPRRRVCRGWSEDVPRRRRGVPHWRAPRHAHGGVGL